MPGSAHPVLARLRAQPDPFCVALACSSPEDLQSRAGDLLARWSFLEIRLDALPYPEAGTAVLQGLVRAHPEATLLATCRTVRSGGQFQGSGRNELSVLQAAAAAGAVLVDLSLETAEELGQEALASLRQAGAAVVLSFHDFTGTGDLQAVLDRMRPFHPDIYKIVPTATNLPDSLRLLELLRATELPLAAMAMGEPGAITRILGPQAGAIFTYAAVAESEATAPGQITADRLHSLYRIGQIGSKTRLLGVAGDPIRSSLSPLMHNAAFRTTGIDAVYLPLQTDNPEHLLQTARALPLHGISVTMPLKQSVMPLLDSVDPLARRIGAVNTITRAADGRLHGTNTDVAGIVVPLERRLKLQDARVLVMGAGGAARAAVFACAERGAQVWIHNRTAETAQVLANEAGAAILPDLALGTVHFDVLLQTTPAGMRGNPRSLPFEAHQLNADLVFDLVYNPTETPLLALARARGLAVIPGVEMFVEQGARQFSLWMGQDAPTDVMQQVVTDELQNSPRP